MSTNDLIGNKVAVAPGENTTTNEEWAALDKQFAADVVDEVLEREQALRPTVGMEIRAKVDTNHPDARRYGLTLEAEECVEGWEWEIERTRVRFDRRQDSDREERTRDEVERANDERRREFAERAASVDPWVDPNSMDAREQLSRAELGQVNREAARLAGKLSGWSRAAISRRLAERVVDGKSMMAAALGVYEELQVDAGRVVPIGRIGEVRSREVTIAGTVTQLWKPSHPKIAQVGLIEDETGVCKFTSWKASDAEAVSEGELVVLRDVAKSWYNGRVSVALTGWSSISFPECRQWWIS